MPVLIAEATPRRQCCHCAADCDDDAIVSRRGTFCCEGCESVFAFLTDHDLTEYYVCEVQPGVKQPTTFARPGFDALDDPLIAARSIERTNGSTVRATFSIPTIHCASCVWLLERLWRLDPGIAGTEVDLLRRSLRVEFDSAAITLRRVAELLAAVGYAPVITNEDGQASISSSHRRLYLQIGIAGFAFGNIMLFSIPRYANGAPLDGGFQRLFDALNVALALPVLLFSAADYFRTAWHAAKARTMTLEVPVALGLAVLFGRSVVDIASSRSEGFMDSFAGLVFFLLLGRLFQRRVFDRIAFDRTFRSFLPLSVRVERDSEHVLVPIDGLHPGDRIVVRANEVVPADAELLDDDGAVDYAFATGEQAPVRTTKGEIVQAGGRAVAGSMRLRVVRAVSHSRLAALWSSSAFARPKAHWLTNVNARFGGWFTVGAIAIAAIGAAAWWPDARASAAVATAVLIIACPCALTLAAPITLGTAMGMLGRSGVYLKQPAVALDLSRIDTIVFDKTGTLTVPGSRRIAEVHGLSASAWELVRRLAMESTHPTSRAIAQAAAAYTGPRIVPGRPQNVREVVGHGLSATVDRQRVVIGGATFIAAETNDTPIGPADATFVVAGPERGWIRFTTELRPGIERAIGDLRADGELYLLSGDHASESQQWSTMFGRNARFRQSPEDKLKRVQRARQNGQHVLFIGDGLNDAGALAAADVGLAVSDETACLAPGCDAIVAGDRLAALPVFLRYARRARHVVIACFMVSVAYNAIGLMLALGGALTPLAAAILMPISSLTIVAISSGAMRWSARWLPS